MGQCVLGCGRKKEIACKAEERLREIMPELADKALDFQQIVGMGGSAVAYRVDVEKGEQLLFVRCATVDDPFRLRRTARDERHMRSLLSSAGLAPRALAEAPWIREEDGTWITVDAFEEAGTLRPEDLQGEGHVWWPKLGVLLAQIHKCPKQGFSAQTPLLPDHLAQIRARFELPSNKLDGAPDRWPSEGPAAALVASHGDFYINNILKSGGGGVLATDFEFGGINFAGVDVAYLFCQELLFAAYGGFSWNADFRASYTPLSDRMAFARAYLAAIESDFDPRQFLLDVEAFTPEVVLVPGAWLTENGQGGHTLVDSYPAACHALAVEPDRLVERGAWAVAAEIAYEESGFTTPTTTSRQTSIF